MGKIREILTKALVDERWLKEFTRKQIKLDYYERMERLRKLRERKRRDWKPLERREFRDRFRGERRARNGIGNGSYGARTGMREYSQAPSEESSSS